MDTENITKCLDGNFYKEINKVGSKIELEWSICKDIPGDYIYWPLLVEVKILRQHLRVSINIS